MGRRRIGVVLVNLGTPAAPTPTAVRRFLKQFLSDQRVVELPRWLWWLILRLFVLPLRPRRVAALYRQIWTTQGSPLQVIMQRQVEAVGRILQESDVDMDWQVCGAMTYGEPALKSVLDGLCAKKVSHILVLPLYPQYSATTTAAVIDQIGGWLAEQRNLPEIRWIRGYHQEPGYIAALADSVRTYWGFHSRAERLLFSFHGIPERYNRQGDPYPLECRKTAEALAVALQLPAESWAMSFQSRFGAAAWVKPYTSELLAQWGKERLSSVQVLCPAFAADCLETLEEIAVQNRQVFKNAGGGHYAYIPALNDGEGHVHFLANLIRKSVSDWSANSS